MSVKDKVPSWDLDAMSIDSSTLALLPLPLAKGLNAVAVRLDPLDQEHPGHGRKLWIACSNPRGTEVEKRLKGLFEPDGFHPQLVFARASQVKRLWRRMEEEQEAARRNPSSSEIAATIEHEIKTRRGRETPNTPEERAKFERALAERETTAQEERTVFEQEMKQWAANYGSDQLRDGVLRGYSVAGAYARERAAREWPGWTVDTQGALRPDERLNPSAQALALLDTTQRTLAQDLNAQADDQQAQVVWVKPGKAQDPSLDEVRGEAVMVTGYLGRYSLYLPVDVTGAATRMLRNLARMLGWSLSAGQPVPVGLRETLAECEALETNQRVKAALRAALADEQLDWKRMGTHLAPVLPSVALRPLGLFDTGGGDPRSIVTYLEQAADIIESYR